MLGLKAMLESKAAHDIFIDANDLLIEKVYGSCFDANSDVLEPHPHLMRVLPTPGHEDANGKEILAQAKQDWIDSVNYYFQAVLNLIQLSLNSSFFFNKL